MKPNRNSDAGVSEKIGISKKKIKKYKIKPKKK
jgi:hypothetical protein